MGKYFGKMKKNVPGVYTIGQKAKLDPNAERMFNLQTLQANTYPSII